MLSPSKKPPPHLTVESQALFPWHRTQVLLSGSQNRPQPRVSAPTAPRLTPRPGGSEALELGERRHFRRQWQGQPISAREAGGAGSPGNHRRASPRRTPVWEALETGARGLRHVALSPRPPPRRAQPTAAPAAGESSSPSRKGSWLGARRAACTHSAARSTGPAPWWTPSRPWWHPPEPAAAPRYSRAAARTRATRTGRRRFLEYFCGHWQLLGASADPLALPSVLGHRPLPSSRSTPRARLSVMAAAGVVTSRPASRGGRVRRGRRAATPAAQLQNQPGWLPDRSRGRKPEAKAQAPGSRLVTKAPWVLGCGPSEGWGPGERAGRVPASLVIAARGNRTNPRAVSYGGAGLAQAQSSREEPSSCQKHFPKGGLLGSLHRCFNQIGNGPYASLVRQRWNCLGFPHRCGRNGRSEVV